MNFERRQFIPDPAEKVNPKTADLKALSAELKRVQSLPELGETEAHNLLYDLKREVSPSTMEALLTRILARVEEECGNLGNFGSFEEGKRLMNVPTPDFIQQLLPQLETFRSSYEVAHYDPLSKKIRVNKDAFFDDRLELSPENLILDLATSGFSDSVTVIHHEVIHSLQDNLAEKSKLGLLSLALFKVLTQINIVIIPATFGLAMAPKIAVPTGAIAALFYFYQKINEDNQKILIEGQAYIGSGRHTATNNPEVAVRTAEQLKKRLKNGYQVLQINLDKVSVMVHDVKRLYALGMSDEAIAEIVKRTRWNSSRKCFDDVENAVQALSKSSGLTESQIDDLVAADDFNTAINVEKMKRIAQEELAKTYRQVVPEEKRPKKRSRKSKI